MISDAELAIAQRPRISRDRGVVRFTHTFCGCSATPCTCEPTVGYFAVTRDGHLVGDAIHFPSESESIAELIGRIRRDLDRVDPLIALVR